VNISGRAVTYAGALELSEVAITANAIPNSPPPKAPKAPKANLLKSEGFLSLCDLLLYSLNIQAPTLSFPFQQYHL
jgi:hypothetical protein